ncbi:MAG: MBOAT family protein, partial [Janthinobacterium lividum]
MLFNTQGFVLGFLPIALGLFYAARSHAARQVTLVVASLAFYAFWDARFVPALVGLTLANWLIVRWWAAHRRQAILGLGVALNLGVLGVCKYADFLGANLAALLGMPFTPFGIILPLGVSFFTFQKISYLLDLRRGDRHVYNLLDFFAFVAFFPQLIAGPLVRHNEIIPQFAQDPHGPALWENLSRGLALFTIGFAKKS